MNTLIKTNELQTRKVRRILTHVVLTIALGIIAILAVPTLLMISVISLIWSAADRIIRWIDS